MRGPILASLYATDSEQLRRPVQELIARYHRYKPDFRLEIIGSEGSVFVDDAMGDKEHVWAPYQSGDDPYEGGGLDYAYYSPPFGPRYPLCPARPGTREPRCYRIFFVARTLR